MTISSETNYLSYAGTGAQVVFPYPFKIYAAGDLLVYRRAAGPVDTLLTLNVDYTVTGTGDPAGGTVVMGAAPTTDQTLIIFRDPPQLQEQDYVEGGEFPAVSHEDSLDKLVSQIQALSARALRTPESGAVLGLTLPAPATTPNGMYLRWNAAGEALEAVAHDPVVVNGCPLEMVNALDYGDGTVSYLTLAAAVAAIGAEERRLYLRRGTWTVTVNLTTPANITLVLERGALLQPANGITLTPLGEMVLGPWQVFDWVGTGAIDLSGSPTADFYLENWGAESGVGNDCAAALAKAYASLGGHQRIRLGKGIWRLASTVTVPASGILYPPDLIGDDPVESILLPDVGAASDGLVIGTTGNTVYGAWVKNINIAGEADCCKTALKLIRWNHGGSANVNVIAGAAENAVRLLGPENCNWDFRLGHFASRVAALGITYGQMTAGVFGGQDGGYGSTYNTIRVLKSNTHGGVRGLQLDSVNDWLVDKGDLENCTQGEADYNNAGTLGGAGADQVSLYAGATTRIAQVFTLAALTIIQNVGVFLLQSNAHGNVVAKLYATLAGAPTGAALATSEVLQASRLNSGSVPWPMCFDFPGLGHSLAAGTYAVSIEFADGDATHYLAVDTDVSAGHSGVCYTYDGAWNAQAYDLRFGLNVDAALKLYNCGRVQVRPQHFEMNFKDVLVDKCLDVQLESLANTGGGRTEIRRSRGVTLGGDSNIGDLRIDPVSVVTVNNVRLNATWFTDYGNTNYTGRIWDWLTYRAAAGMQGNNLHNYIANHLLNRWQATHADGWTKDASHTWTQTGTGLVDTTRHAADFAALIDVAADSSLYYGVTAEQLNAFRGQWVTYSVWLMFPAAQNWGANAHFLQLATTLAAWVGATAYRVGDAVNNGGVKLYCVGAGTSAGGAPANPASGEYVADGTVLWLRWDGVDLSGGVMDNTVSDGVWRRWSVSQFIPRNITSATVRLALYVQVGPANTTVYLAEPMLNLGGLPARGVLPGLGEFGDNIWIKGTRITKSAAMPVAGFYRENDIVLNDGASVLDGSNMVVMGWYRLTTGSGHVSGTDWAIMNISHVSPAT